MAKLAQTSVKYVIKGSFDADGVVEKPDVIGALFGQTEGLLGPELDLRELQRTGRLGRIEVRTTIVSGKSRGEILLPSSLDSTETALIAAAIETIDRVGPCNAKIVVKSIDDLRTLKRKYIADRSKILLSALIYKTPESSIITEELKQAVRSSELKEYKGLPAGPEVENSDSLIILEGRADVLNLLKHGLKNVVAVDGTSIPPAIIGLSKEKETTVFIDGDRGGELILKELKQLVDIDFITRAPSGKEVEELTKKEIFKAIRDRIPVEQIDVKNNERFEKGVVKESIPKTRIPKVKKKVDSKAKKFFKEQLEELVGTRAASIYDDDMKFSGRVPVKELHTSLRQIENPSTIILDGFININLIELAKEAGVQNLVGTSVKNKPRGRSNINVLSKEDLK